MSRSSTLPPSVALYVLLCLLSLFVASGYILWFLAVVGAAIAGSYILRVRLPRIWLPSLLLAGFLLGLAILLTPTRQATPMLGDVRATLLSGQALGILALIQFYRPTPRDPARPALIALIAATLALLGACSTYDEGLIRWLIPTTVLVGVLAWRGIRTQRSTSAVTGAAVAAFLVLVLGMGLFLTAKASDYRDLLTEWGNRLMGDRNFELVGMARQPTLGPMFDLRGSTARVLRLEGRPQSLHLRGLSYDTYSNGRWWPVVTARNFRTINAQELAASKGLLGPHVNVTLLSSDNLYFYAPLNTVTMEMGSVERLDWADRAGGPLRGRVSLPFAYSYTEGPENKGGLFARPTLTEPEDRVGQLAVPEDIKPALSTIAMRLTTPTMSPAQKVERVTAYLLENYPYSLRFDPGRGDPVLNFLTREPRQGAHCEVFASAAALLLRSAGVPARYVTGYFAHEQEGENSILVRQRDAHAWCEAWIDGQGWRVVEATPPTGWPENDRTPVEIWRHLWERVQDLWLELVSWLATRDPWQLILLAIGPLLIGMIRVLLRRGKRPEAAVIPGLPPPALREYAASFERALQQRGKPVNRALPWSEQLDTLPEAVQTAALRFVTRYNQVRFGEGAMADAGLASALQEVEQAVKESRAGSPGRGA